MNRARFQIRFGRFVRQAFASAERVSVSGNNPHVYSKWFDTEQIKPQTAFTLRRTSSRIADIRGPGINKVDLTISKRIPITEKVSMLFQSEFYNAFNHTNFDNPNTTAGGNTFGIINAVRLQPRNIQLSGRITF